MLTRHFKRVVKEMCRNCYGSGQVAVQDGKRIITIVCPVCTGYRMIRKTIEGDTSVEPYDPGSYRQKTWRELSEKESNIVDEETRYP